MRFVLFYHSLLSDWNHGNAHFLRGYVTELLARGHEVTVYEPEDAWSLKNLLADAGESALDAFRAAYPSLTDVSTPYNPDRLRLTDALADADVVIAHEWNDPRLIARLNAYRREHHHLRLLFHDTHHRAVSAPEEMERYNLSAFDGALVFGEVLRKLYLREGWTAAAWVWHEAADTRVFRPLRPRAVLPESDLVWVGNWGDGERAAELREFLLGPAARLRLRTTIHGVRYPVRARKALRDAAIRYAGYLANADAPRVFARHRVTVHVPRRPYVETLPGIPTIRVFEALACGIPLVSAPWEDAEGLFRVGEDFRMVRDGREMTTALRELVNDPAAAAAQAQRGLETVLARHTCAHRVDELLAICQEIDATGAHSPAERQLPALTPEPAAAAPALSREILA